MSVTRKRFDDAPYERQCDATVIAVGADGVELDQTVCYARSGGQAGDSGTLTLADGRVLALTDTVYADERRRIVHVLAEGVAPPPVGERVTVAIDWPRRHRLMRLHTCLHLLGALVPAPVTGCSISPDSARIDFDLPESTLDKADLTERLNALITAATDVTVNAITPEELAAQPDLVRTIGAAPPAGTERIRIIEIPGVDRQPCGGTHVANTGEIGAVTVTKIEKKSRTNRRVVVAFA
ncbi:alanyl-tRNA editing protein [Achromobacter xylosoxidans]|jgi:misacylated tRNA(Ala) deacylase|uniref:Alanyl-tRNA editing protein n=4 Tax=Alcaligenes xylosoxydans xylosoxydans TaxID=85698 RepID=A0A9W5AH30_ALCXX|nr:alanyl-tRNA editing protein [Achromobacter xylosoxidans]AXA79467.1 serine-tRNA(Ala) deacylase AlaX [Achromobacter xylosoxidans]KAA5920315.1 alanyl-tRNA editing protein [Achromobacter xylosoxidans]MCH1987736.1 alanyl-tRNA editing protein [Achromobacter xylosoxidans]MCH1997889.1 alanyl-tRNA editing protein [Achromobacter xylosoxidans]MCH4578533.1 alanyl-tRNA editing protein [Achromobacter xylosoxidans]